MAGGKFGIQIQSDQVSLFPASLSQKVMCRSIKIQPLTESPDSGKLRLGAPDIDGCQGNAKVVLLALIIRPTL
jgi:hypothetical protein